MKIKLVFMIVLILGVLFISTGYAALNTNLSISGESSLITPRGIKIYSVELLSNNDSYERYSTTFSDDEIIFNPYLSSTVSNMVYEITIHNNTEEDYILKDVEELYVSNNNISFRLNDFMYGTTISSFSYVTFTMTLSSLRSNQTGNLNLKFIYELFEESPDIAQVLTGVKSSTNAYVKTGFFPSSESRIVLDFTFLGPRDVSTWLFSSRKAYLNQMFGIAWNSTESLLQFNNVSYNFGVNGYLPNTRYTADISKTGLILNGVNYSNPADTVWQGIFEFYIFANNEARWVRGHTNGQAIIHSLQIYESGVLVLDATPVVLDNGETVFFNNVTSQPLTNVGTLIPIYE